MFTSVSQARCEMPQCLHWRILHGHVVVTCACKLFLVIVSSQLAFVQETTLRGHDSRWALKDKWSGMANARPWLYYLRCTNHNYSEKWIMLPTTFVNYSTLSNTKLKKLVGKMQIHRSYSRCFLPFSLPHFSPFPLPLLHLPRRLQRDIRRESWLYINCSKLNQGNPTMVSSQMHWKHFF